MNNYCAGAQDDTNIINIHFVIIKTE